MKEAIQTSEIFNSDSFDINKNENINNIIVSQKDVQLKLSSKLSLAFGQLIENSSSQALANTKRKNQMYLKIFWFICFLVGLGAAIGLSINYLITFSSYPVTVSALYVIESPANFPAVTICKF